jgi:thiamine biosynthesis protein ThiS
MAELNATVEPIEITVNGEEALVSSGLTISQLLLFLDMREDRVAVEVNKKIVNKRDWQSTGVLEGDKLEIVQFVGGG